jgi:hypothetical protein
VTRGKGRTVPPQPGRSTRKKPKRPPKKPTQFPAAEQPRLRPRAGPIIDRLPQMGPEATLQVWSNALRLLERGGAPQTRQAAQVILDAVEDAWLKRSLGTPEGWFPWPSTSAPGGDGSLTAAAWMELGPLKALGYTVGQEGEPPSVRRAILRRVFEGVIPPVFPRAYLMQWGEPSSPARLHKMADSIASFTRSAKRRDAVALREAIADWEMDLAHLRNAFYVGRFGFAWPTTRDT